MGLLSTLGAASARAYGFTRSAIASAVDAYFNRVTLLLPGNGTNGAQNNTFLDSSSNNFTITRNGNATQGTFSPFSQTGWSNFFNGSSNLTIAANTALNLVSGAFTIEAFVFPTATGSSQQIVTQDDGGSNSQGWQLARTTTGAPNFLWFRSSTRSDNESITGGTLPANTWSHLAVTYDGTTLRLFVNGAVVASKVSPTFFASNVTTAIGAFPNNSSTWFTGYVSNVRIIKGSAAYTSAFTPSTTQLTAVSGTSLLTCQTNRFVDSSGTPKAITTNGTPSVQAFSPFAPTAAYSAATNGGSGYFDGSGDYVSFPSSQASLLPGSGAFTYEIWCYQTVSTSNAALFSYGSGTGNLRFFVANSTSVTLWNGSSNLVNQSTTNPLNSWQHFVVQRDGSNVVSIYQNGTRIYNNTVASTFNAGTLAIGFDSGGTAWNGYISGFKATIGSALYSGTSITVPTAPPSPTGATACVQFTNGGIIDATSKNVLETVGNAQISTTQSKWGGSSMYFDGAGDWLTTPITPNITIPSSSSFTIEGWFYWNTVPTGYAMILSDSGGASSRYFAINGSRIDVQFGATAGTTAYASYTLSNNTWFHIAVVRNGTTVSIFVNGVSQTVTQATQSNPLFDQGSTLYLGRFGGTTAYEFNGYIDDLRISKFARYTANFTPPAAAFPVQ